MPFAGICTTQDAEKNWYYCNLGRASSLVSFCNNFELWDIGELYIPKCFKEWNHFKSTSGELSVGICSYISQLLNFLLMPFFDKMSVYLFFDRESQFSYNFDFRNPCRTCNQVSQRSVSKLCESPLMEFF